MTTVTSAADGTVVSIHYTLRDDDGDVVDSSVGNDPLDYLHGASNIVPGLEAAMTGKQVGDKFKVTVTPADGYGEVEGPGPRPVPRSAFPDDLEIEAGMQFFVRGPDGEPFPVWVADLQGDDVLVDSNHPLAGETLHFEVEVMSIRAATSEEIEHGHPHGPDGHGGHHH
ncbi:MAG: peptidylprolyl isomerase [Kofleriaceae bacterium]|nr:peptidylprolyl isomerase [Myxococcales bacterium]MCB9563914.1 peptidylprolyl isomerase [Kofleriaceae bacterium]